MPERPPADLHQFRRDRYSFASHDPSLSSRVTVTGSESLRLHAYAPDWVERVDSWVEERRCGEGPGKPLELTFSWWTDDVHDLLNLCLRYALLYHVPVLVQPPIPREQQTAERDGTQTSERR